MTLEVELARAFAANKFMLGVENVELSVVSGHISLTTLPFFSKKKHHVILYS